MTEFRRSSTANVEFDCIELLHTAATRLALPLDDAGVPSHRHGGTAAASWRARLAQVDRAHVLLPLIAATSAGVPTSR